MQVGPRKSNTFAEPNCLTDVAAFHTMFGAPVVDEPTLPDAKRCELRVNLLQEELDEFKAALKAGDIVEAADALADIQYVLAGAVHELGMGTRFKALFDEVQRSNMSKACASRAEAEATVAHYAEKDQPAQIEEKDGKFLVKRIADNKVIIAQHRLRPCLLIIPRRSGRRLRPHAPLRPSTRQVLKSINYSPAALQPILEAGIDKENQAQ